MLEARKLGYRALAPAIAALAVAALTWDAQAQVTSAQQSAIRSSCRSDFMAKCSGVTPGGKDALACLQKNVNGLSPSCKSAVAATLPPPAPAAAAKPVEAKPVEAKPVEARPVAAPKPAEVKPVEAAPAAAAAAPAPPAAAPPAPAPAAVVTAPPPKAKVAAPPRAVAAKPAAVAPAVAPPPAAAAPPAPTAAQQSAIKASCRSDFMAKCSGVTPGGKDALSCLQRNAGTLSGACKKAVNATLGAAAPAAAAAVAPAPPPAVAPTPVAVTPAAPAPRPPNAPLVNAAVMLRACKLDLIRYCNDVAPGGGRALACLAAHEQNLTIRCKTARKVTSPLR